MFGDDTRGPGLLIAKFGMLMDVPAPGDQLAFNRGGLFSDRRLQGNDIRLAVLWTDDRQYRYQ